MAAMMVMMMMMMVVRPAVPFAAVVRQVPVRLLSDLSSSLPSGIRQVFVRFPSGSFWAHWALNGRLGWRAALPGSLVEAWGLAWSKFGVGLEH